MKMSKAASSRIITLLLACILLFSFVACGKKGTPDNPDVSSPVNNDPANVSTVGDAGKTLSVGISSDPGTMDPAAQGGGSFMSVIACVLEPLWEVTSDDETIWLLAESVDKVSPTQWTIHLRQGVTFSNGNPFTADDVLFSLKTVSESFSMVRTQSIDIENSAKIDDYTVDLRFTEYNIQAWLAFTLLFMYDAESYDESSFGMNPIGTGPYVLSDYVLNSHVKLTARDGYWREAPAIKNVEFRILAETSQVVNALETKMIDIGDIASSDVEYIRGLDKFNMQEYTGTAWTVLGFNPLDNSPFHNIEARYAVTHLIDKEAIVNLVYDGNAHVMNGPVVSSAFDYSDKYNNMNETYSVGYDMDLAKQYAEHSGLVGKSITIATNGDAQYVTIAEMLKNRLEEIGVSVTIQNHDYASFITALCNPPEYDIAIQGYIIPNMYISNAYANGVIFTPAYNVPGSWEGVDRYLEIAPLANSTADDAERAVYLDEMMEIFIEACIIYSVCEPTNSRAIAKDIQGADVLTSAGLVRYQDMSFTS